MGRNKIQISLIENEKERRVCFKKRRIGAVKKLMQLSQLTGCKINLQIYSSEDHSLLEYKTPHDEKVSLSDENIDSYVSLHD